MDTDVRGHAVCASAATAVAIVPDGSHEAALEVAANARLIAAAPRMLAEIDDSLLEHFSRAGKDCECHGCYRKRALLREIHGGQ